MDRTCVHDTPVEEDCEFCEAEFDDEDEEEFCEHGISMWDDCAACEKAWL